jgi:Thioredoxin-like proteins and domains
MEQQIRDKVEQFRKLLQNDGGDCEIVSIEGKTVTLRLRGACGSCPHATATLKDYIEANLRAELDSEITVERAL